MAQLRDNILITKSTNGLIAWSFWRRRWLF